MSWKGFTKAVNRGTTSLLQTAGAIERTADREFDEEERRYRTLESKAERLQREAKGYLDAMRAMSLAQARMATTIESFYDETAPFGPSAVQYRQTMEKLEEEARAEMDATYRRTVLEPLGRFCEFFPDYNEALKRRHNKLLDYDSVRARHRKLVEKPSDDPTRLPRTEDEVAVAKRTYETHHAPLRDELPKLVSIRTDYLDPSFEALVRLQYHYGQEGLTRLQALQSTLQKAGMDAGGAGGGGGGAPGERSLLEPAADRALEGQVENVLAKMRELPICSVGAGGLGSAGNISGSSPVQTTANVQNP